MSSRRVVLMPRRVSWRRQAMVMRRSGSGGKVDGIRRLVRVLKLVIAVVSLLRDAYDV